VAGPVQQFQHVMIRRPSLFPYLLGDRYVGSWVPVCNQPQPQPPKQQAPPAKIPLELEIYPRVQPQREYREIMMRDANGNPYLVRGYQTIQ
jgi:hypothetical protein